MTTHYLRIRKHYYQGHLGGQKGWQILAKGTRKACLSLMASYTAGPAYLGYGEYAYPDYQVVPAGRLTPNQRDQGYWAPNAEREL